MKPKYEEFTPEEIEDLDDTCAELAEENSALREVNAKLFAALQRLLSVALSDEDAPDLDAQDGAIAEAQEAIKEARA